VKQPLPGAFSGQFHGLQYFFFGKVIHALSEVQALADRHCAGPVVVNASMMVTQLLASACLLFPPDVQR
jgi:hypothetical protein